MQSYVTDRATMQGAPLPRSAARRRRPPAGRADCGGAVRPAAARPIELSCARDRVRTMICSLNKPKGRKRAKPRKRRRPVKGGRPRGHANYLVRNPRGRSGWGPTPPGISRREEGGASTSRRHQQQRNHAFTASCLHGENVPSRRRAFTAAVFGKQVRMTRNMACRWLMASRVSITRASVITLVGSSVITLAHVEVSVITPASKRGGSMQYHHRLL